MARKTPSPFCIPASFASEADKLKKQEERKAAAAEKKQIALQKMEALTVRQKMKLKAKKVFVV
jgi:hypothetical protein